MAGFFITSLLLLLSAVSTVVALVPGNVALRTRNGPGMSDADTVNAVGRALHLARLQPRSDDVLFSVNKTSLYSSWVDATLFQYSDSTNASGVDIDGGIKIICSKCYVNGSVAGNLTFTGNYNFTEAVDNVGNELWNATEEVADQLEAYIEEVAEDAAKAITTFNFTDLPSLPTVNVSMDLDNTTGLPGTQILFEFDDLEIYLDLDIVLSTGATYTLPIYTSETIYGVDIDHLTVGAVFSVQLILIADAEVDISSGIHIKLDEGLVFDLEMFNTNVSSIELPDGTYELLPVTVSGEGSLRAILSLKASLGVDVSAPTSDLDLEFSAGIGTDVFAYVADFAMIVNGTLDADDGDCELAAAAEYTFAVGAAAGATLAVDSYSWGPYPNTTIPVWYTTLASVCATTKTASSISTSTASPLVTARAALGQRDDVAATAVTTSVSSTSYTITSCKSPGLVNCPVSLQTTFSYDSVISAIVAVQSGSTETIPTTTSASITAPIPFGSNTYKLGATSGTPTSYIPQSTSTGSSSTGVASIINGKTHGTSNKLIIGLSVGLGVPFLALVAFGAVYFVRKRRQYSPAATDVPDMDVSTAYDPHSAGTSETTKTYARVSTSAS